MNIYNPTISTDSDLRTISDIEEILRNRMSPNALDADEEKKKKRDGESEDENSDEEDSSKGNPERNG